MKEIIIDEILYEGRRYQLDKPLTLKVKEIKEAKETEKVSQEDSNFATQYYNNIPYQMYYTQQEDPWKHCQHTYDQYSWNYDNGNYCCSHCNNWNYSYNYYNKKDK